MNTKKLRGFAAMSKEMKSKIASMGGIAAHKTGNAHEWTHEEARKAGRKGGLAKSRKAKLNK
jgi:general stress protein YciG